MLKNLIIKHKTAILYTVLIFAVLFLSIFVITKTHSENILGNIELQTFDLRQKLISENKKASDDIVIVTVDEDSYEYLFNKFGEWPLPRNIWADIAVYLESKSPDYIAFDLLFVHSMNGKNSNDGKLAEIFSKYDNIWTAINFDSREFVARTPVVLPEKLTAEPITILNKNFSPLFFTNCRSIIDGIIKNTSKIGQVNTPKSDDGVNRTVPMFVAYPRYNKDLTYNKIDLYPYMTLGLAKDYIDKHTNSKNAYVVDKQGNLIIQDKKIPMTKDGQAYLNWYGESGTSNDKSFTYVPLWKVIEDMRGSKNLADDMFKGKIVFIGTSVFSLSDIKSVPTSKYMPGVEIHATLLNNIIDNNFIIPVDEPVNIAISICIAILIGLIAYFSNIVFVGVAGAILAILVYCIFATWLMGTFNIWIWIMNPILYSTTVFIATYLIKYIIKSRDFEHTYKLATTDGLTDLYNHRFFQEQMKISIDEFKRTKRKFSMIIVDIDFFKKFNDNYGHQAGDAVLRQVAQTLKNTVRSSDIVCRYGGEEMTIILKDTNNDAAIAAAKKICSNVSKTKYKISANATKEVTISVGVSTCDEHGETTEELVDYADKCLYYAKTHGRNQVGTIPLEEEEK